MKITATFVDARPRLALPLAVAAWTGAMLLIAAAGGFGLRLVDLRAEEPRLHSRLAKLEAQWIAAAVEPLPPPSELHALRQRVQALNRLSGLRGWTTPQFLGWLGEKLPDDVYLLSVHHKRREGEALLVAESPSAEALTSFLLRLEAEPRFGEVLLSRQGSAAGPRGGLVQFEIRVRWKS